MFRFAAILAFATVLTTGSAFAAPAPAASAPAATGAPAPARPAVAAKPADPNSPAAMAAAAVSPLTSDAANDLTKLREIPTFKKEMTPQQFLNQTEVVSEKPKGDKYMAFQMRLPKNWTRVGERLDDIGENQSTGQATGQLSHRLLGKIVKYYSPMTLEAPSKFDMQALELEHQITARNWFFGYILSNGYTLQGMSIISDDRVEALYVTVENAIPYVVRTAAIINGPRMVLVSYYTPEDIWPKERAMQEAVIDSFQFVSPEKVKIEVSKTYAFIDMLRFDYPASWRLLAPNIYSVDGMDARLLNTRDGKKLIGEINMRIVSTELETSLPQEVSYLKENIKNMGLEVGDLLETPTRFKYKPQVTFARIEVYNAKGTSTKIQDHEYWLAVMAEDRYYYIITMITPSRTADFYNWAQNTEAFQMIVESIRP